MSIDRVINLLATITLIEMMVTIGLGVTVGEVLAVATQWRLLVRTALANYVVVPAATVGLLLLFRPQPAVAAGILIPAVCPGAPFGPPFTAMAKGNVGQAVGLMVVLAGSSAVLGPVLLGVLMPAVGGGAPVRINAAALVATLLVSQLLPLCVGLGIRHRRAALAERLKGPMSKLSTVLNLATLGVILAVQFRMLMEVRLIGYAGMIALVMAAVVAGWLLGGPGKETRKALVMTTSVRNVGVSLVIVSSSLAGTAAVTATTAFGLLQTVLMALVALAWGRWAAAAEVQRGAYGLSG